MYLKCNPFLLCIMSIFCSSSSPIYTGSVPIRRLYLNEGGHGLFFDMKYENVNEVIEGCLQKFRNEYTRPKILSLAYKVITLDEYVEKTIKFIDLYLKKNVEYDMRKIENILKKVYCAFAPKTVRTLAIFTAHALCITNVFNIFEESGDEKYKGRGLLMIREEKNYEILDSFFTLSPSLYSSFLEYPEDLASISSIAIVKTVKWFEDFARNDALILTFESSIKLLHPNEWESGIRTAHNVMKGILRLLLICQRCMTYYLVSILNNLMCF